MTPWIVLSILIVFLYFQAVPWTSLLVIFIYLGVPLLAYRRTKAAEGETTARRILPKLKNAFTAMTIVGLFFGMLAAWQLTLLKPMEAGGEGWLARFHDIWAGLGLPLDSQIFYFLDMWMIWGVPLGLYAICRAKEAGERRKETLAGPPPPLVNHEDED